MMGDTAIEWAMWAAEIAYGTYAGSPRTELMRQDIVKQIFLILKAHYHHSMKWEEYWNVVVERIHELQARRKAQLEGDSFQKVSDDPLCSLTIEQFFGTIPTEPIVA